MNPCRLTAAMLLSVVTRTALSAQTLAFTGATVIDGTTRSPVENATLLVRDGRVIAVDVAARVAIPANATRVPLTGKVVIPGLINAHGHVNAIKDLSTYAAYGITTVYSLGGEPAEVMAARRDQNTPALRRARVYVAGPVLTPNTVDEARTMVAEVAAQRVDIVKIRVDDNLGTSPKMPRDVYRAVIREAHARGLRVAVHFYYLADAKELLDAGADFLSHSVRDMPVDDAFIEAVRAKGVCYSPTLMREVSTFVFETTPDFAGDSLFLAHANPQWLTALKDPARQAATRASSSAQTYKAQLPVAMRNLKTLADAGVPIAMGTDTGPMGRFQGIFELMEMEKMVAAGLSTQQTLHAATKGAATCMQLDRDVGTLEPGKWADFVVLHKSPLERIEHLRGIASVWIAGNLVTRPSSASEQTQHGTQPPARLVASFDGLGVGFVGPHGNTPTRNPSDNSLAVGRDHIVQTVNTRFAIFTKKGKLFDTTGRVLYGAVPTNTVFRGFGGPCELRNNGDAVVRYDQLADRWLIVMPIFTRGPRRADEPPTPRAGEPAALSMVGRVGQPGAAVHLFDPPRVPSGAPQPVAAPAPSTATAARDSGSYAMCYAISTGPDPMGPYYRYEFVRPLFPDYPRPAVWPDGYYVPTSTGDDVIEKHACVVDRARMLRGLPATEQCVIINDVNFLNNVDLDGQQLPPRGAPNLMLATGGTQLRNVLGDDALYLWSFHVDWNDPTRTRVSGPTKLGVAPYQYLCGGQLTNCVPQPGTTRRLDAQGDKLMARVVYRRMGNTESIVAVHSVATAAGAGGVRWYELRLDARDRSRTVRVHQQGTYAPDSSYRWMASPAMDRFGNIGIGYSFGGLPHFPGQRFAARRASDALHTLPLREQVLVNGEAAQENTLRWEDYTQTAVDPSDDCTIWYVGDYLKAGASNYSTRIGAFRMPGCR